MKATVVVVSMLFLALCFADTAGANWGSEGRCNGFIGEVNEHCYSLSETEIGTAEKTEGLLNEEDSVNMDVPNSVPSFEAFVSHEAWTDFKANQWLETGQIGSSPSEVVHPFLQVWEGGKKVTEYEDLEISLGKSEFHDYWTADVNKKGLWCVYWFYPNFKEAWEHGPVHCVEGWPRYDSFLLQVGLEAGDYVEPESDGTDIVETAYPHDPFETWKAWTKANVKKRVVPNRTGTCASNNPWWTEYPGSITFGAGTGVCGGKFESSAVKAPSTTRPWSTHDDAAESAPKLSLSQVRQVATEKAAVSTGTLSVSEGTVSAAEAAFPGGGYSPITQDDETWLGREAFLVTMHGSFPWHGSIRPGSNGLTGSYLALVIDAHTGAVTAKYDGDTAPGSAGPITTMAAE
jgi:hypothetical protein